jgi:hypothetical protein
MPEPGDSFTLYLRGESGPRIREVLKPFGNGGDLERWTLEAWNAEVVLSGGAQVALIRVPTENESSVRTLITELHQAALDGGLVLSDDVFSKKSPEELMRAFGLENERAEIQRAGRPNARWGMNRSLLFLAIAGALVVLAIYGLGVLNQLAHRAIGGG